MGERIKSRVEIRGTNVRVHLYFKDRFDSLVLFWSEYEPRFYLGTQKMKAIDLSWKLLVIPRTTDQHKASGRVQVQADVIVWL
jgi:hypothetical protein